MPGIPSVLIHTGSGARLVSTLFSAPPGRTTYSCMFSGPTTWSPGAKSGEFDAYTTPAPSARMTSPIPTGGT